LANLRLGFFFELFVLDGFTLATGVSVAKRTAPFTLTIFILGGAGWFDFRLRYLPRDRKLIAETSIGVFASASLAIALGPIKGGIYAYFGIVVEHRAETGKSSQLSVAIVLMFSGHVSILSFISIDLVLGLEAQYTSGGGLVGRGYVSLRIKICWCFTLKVSASVTYGFGNASGGSRGMGISESFAALPAAAKVDARVLTPAEFATEYANMFA